MTETSKSIVHMNFLKATTKITETSSITFSKVKTWILKNHSVTNVVKIKHPGYVGQ